jgi:protein-L-isoaspartate(D-aspartate) O-methyltransferase
VVTEQLTSGFYIAARPRRLAFSGVLDHSCRNAGFSKNSQMIDFVQARRAMVDSQVRVNDVTDAALIAAMLAVPREAFVPEARANLAYIDDDLCVLEAAAGKPARYLMEPMVLARMIQALELKPDSKVLDVGCATGYSSAVLSRVAGEVVALEADASLAAIAKRELRGAKVEVVSGAVTAGWPSGAPYDAILVGGAIEEIPESLTRQLRDGGRLAAVIRNGGAARAMLYVRTGTHGSARRLFDAAIPPLPGFEKPQAFVF